MISSAECNKVIYDILGETELFTDFENTDKMKFLTPIAGLNSKYSQFYGKNKMPNNKEIQRKSEHKIAFLQKDENARTILLYSADDMLLVRTYSVFLESLQVEC